MNLCALLIFAFISTFKEVSGHSTEEDAVMLCRKCGETILKASQLKYVPSSLSQSRWNKTILGLPHTFVQKFENPQKAIFNLITAKAANILAHEQAYSDATWFPGFAWRISVCPRCHAHLGWKFQPINFNHLTVSENDTFVGLILDNLLEEKESDTLLVVPKSYLS